MNSASRLHLSPRGRLPDLAPNAGVPDRRTAVVNRPRPTGSLSAYGSAVLLVFIVAFGIRLAAVLRGGGLFGTVGYDGSVYYSAAAGLAHGLLPYRDFLVLHPPGIVLALLPFAALGRLIGDPQAFALARVTWLLLGALNALLVARILRPIGTRAAIAGAFFYAVFVPALYTEHSTSLEAVGSTCLLGAVLLLTGAARTGSTSARVYALAGVLLGVSAGVKIWGVVLAVALVGWVLRVAGIRRAAAVLGGSALGATVVCLPFFLTAPATMWRLVVLDQLGRRSAADSLTARLVGISGLSEIHIRHQTLLLAVVAVMVLTASVLAAHESLGRLALLLVVVTVVLLLVAPSWSLHYTGLAAPPAALLVGCAVAGAGRRLKRLSYRRVAAGLAVAGLVAYSAASLPGLTFGTPFNAAPLKAALTASPGCVTTDDPTVLIETDTLRRNLARGCPLMADLGGYSYDLQPGASRRTSRAADPQWQRFALYYLASGRATVVARFVAGPGFSKATKKIISGWPVLARSGSYQLQQPPPTLSEVPR
jgi:alpha-1,2-mannosyltransferase